MVTVVKRKLTGSTDGYGIVVAATSTPGTLVHTAVAGTTAGTYDEIFIEAQNIDTTGTYHTLTLEYGGATATQNIIDVIPARTGLRLVVNGLLLQDALTIKAFADMANKVVIYGYVNAITD